jgi:hypothetical protein
VYRTGALVTAILFAVAALFAVTARESARVRHLGAGPAKAGGAVERCVSCHVRPDEDPGGAHARAAVGCASCHLGNPLAFEKGRAHEGMEPEPGALSTVASTCGRAGCHPREAERLASSLMVRGSGIIGVDRWAFGETSAPESADTMMQLTSRPDPTPAEGHLRKLCAGCHLGTRRGNRDDAIRGNGSGCAACHVARRKAGERRPHPPVDSRIGDDRCFGCHSRSGRISLTYQGLFEVEPDQRERCAPGPAETLEDGRPVCRTSADVHLASGLGCVDCHLHTDLMGDGTRHDHKERQVEVTCEACHGPAPAESETTWSRVKDPISRDILRTRKESRPESEKVRLGKRGTPLWNLRPGPGGKGWVLLIKSGGKQVPVKQTPQDRNHALKGHERLSCSSCHAAWAPLCTTCHVGFDPAGKQWDFAAGAETRGRWTERSEGFGAGRPALGVRSDGRLFPAIPGMLMTVRPGGGRERTVRLYAPIEPHATGKSARTCGSCHSPQGARSVEGEVPWEGTRTAFRPLDAGEIRKVSAVAANPAFRAECRTENLDSRRPTP